MILIFILLQKPGGIISLLDEAWYAFASDFIVKLVLLLCLIEARCIVFSDATFFYYLSFVIVWYFQFFESRIYVKLNIRHYLNSVVLLGLMSALLCETVCFLSLHMKHFLRSCTRHSKTTSALSNRNFLELVSQYLIMQGR